MRAPSRLDRARSAAATAIRGGLGDRVGRLGPRPAQPLVLYEFEACPFCRKVREALSILDLEAEIRPCPRGGTRFRPDAIAKGGVAKFPFLIDPNRDRMLHESDTIVAELFARYGDQDPPLFLRPRVSSVVSALSGAPRLGHGRKARPSRAPDQLLELWGFESSPETRLVREVLCELELPHLSRPIAHGSPRRADFRARFGEVEVPYLHDPERGVSISGAKAACEHLERTYALPS